jgi:signal transduction histidine kinase
MVADNHKPVEAEKGQTIDWDALLDLLEHGEDQLVDRFFHYAKKHDYTRYTSTLREAWRMSAVGLTTSLLQALRAWRGVPEMSPDEAFDSDPAAAFGKLEATRHRERGVSLTMFLGLFKYFRQAYHDILRASPLESGPDATQYHLFMERAFDRFELGFLAEWTACSKDDLVDELQSTNRRITNEKNKYVTIFESISSPVLFVSADGLLENLNHRAATLLLGESLPGAVYYREGGLQAHFAWLVPWLLRFEQERLDELGFAVSIATSIGRRSFEGRLQRMLDGSAKFQGTIVILNDVTEREAARAQLQQAHDLLEQRVAERTAELQTAADLLQQEMVERRRAEDEREATRQQLLHAQKLEAIGTLAGGVAHDLNNLLQMIQGNTELMSFLLPEGDEELAHMTQEVLRATERSAALVRQLLLFSRKQPMRFQPVAMGEITRGMARMLERIIGEGITMVTELEPDQVAVSGDPGSLEQVVMNLVVNARDALPQGGTITLSTELVHFEEHDQAYPGVEPGRYLCLQVEDDGVGMDGATRARIFEPFFTTKEAGHGTGLGLSVVYGIVREHGGWINVYSEPEVGTSFRVYLPILGKAEAIRGTSAVPLEQLYGAGQRLLLVEDEAGVRSTVHSALEQAGYRVCSASNADEALTLVAQQGPVDLVLTDVVLPGLTGPQLMERLRRTQPELRALYVSGYTATANSASLQQRGDQLLPKPFSLRQLLLALRELLATP